MVIVLKSVFKFGDWELTYNREGPEVKLISIKSWRFFLKHSLFNILIILVS